MRVLCLLMLLLCSCADNNFDAFGQVLSQTGLMSGSQANAIIKFGNSVSKSGFSVEEEYYIGRSVAATILSKYRPYNDRALTAYVNKIANVLTNVSDRPETFIGYHVMVLDTAEINAVSAPGGYIFVSRGFIKILTNEDALASVIAHEIAHIVKSHGIYAISKSNLTNSLMLLGKETAAAQTSGVANELTNVFGDSVGDITNTLLVKGYSRRQEYESDAYAVELLNRAGYNPSAIVTSLNAVAEAQKVGSSGGWMSTHPEAEDRLEQVQELISKNESSGQEKRNFRFKQIMK